MPYWEVLGRTAVTQGTQETADRITQFLTYSGVDATISFDEERSVYIVSVPQEQADLAEKLIKNFEEMEQAPEREAESAPPESFLSRSPVFVRAEERFKNTTNSAYAFLTAGSFVFLLALIRCVMVFLKYRQDSAEACLLDLGMGTVFMSFGVYTLHKANEIRDKIKEENVFLTEAIEWFVSTYSAIQLDETIQAAADENTWLPFEERYFLRRSLIFVEIRVVGTAALWLPARLGAFDQPDAADDEGDADHDLRQLIHHQIEGAEEGVVLTPTPHQVVEGVHQDVLIGDEDAKGNECPAHQLVAVQHHLHQPFILGVKVDEVIVRGGRARGDLRPEVEGVKEAVHPHHDQEKRCR